MPPRIGPRRPVRVFLAEWRESKNLTQEALGLRFEPPVAKGTISRLEARPFNISLGVLGAYAEALNVKPTDLYRPPPADDELPGQTSLDELAAELDPELRERAIKVIELLAGRRAS
jgi:transcriptional regulator with XRE-family HTH domain